MHSLPGNSIKLCYLDPPFFSGAQYEKIWNDKGETASFEDRWKGGIDTYIEWLYDRVSAIYDLLAPDGSIFLHCDHHADYRIRYQILDKIFGKDNFRNHIIWHRSNPKGNATRRMANNSDSIYYYTKSDNFTFNIEHLEHSEKYLKAYKNIDPDTGRRYQLTALNAPATNNPSPNMVYEFMGITRTWRWTKERMIEALEQGLIIQTKAGNVPRYKRYLDEQFGATIDNLWIDIPNIQAHSKERIGYPTQKPEALVERIIKMASNQGDIVLDPFMGGGTTPFVANKLGRQFIGIDASAAAVSIAKMRLDKKSNAGSATFGVKLHKYVEERLREMNPHDFAGFICQHMGGKSNPKKQGDRGIDGWNTDDTPIQVKQQDGVSRERIALFATDARSNNIALFDKKKANKQKVGTIVAFSFTREAYAEAAKLRMQQDIDIALKRVDEVVGIAGKPSIEVNFTWEEIETMPDCKRINFTATAAPVEGRKIVNYAWSFNYDTNKKFEADEFRCSDGKISTTLPTGQHAVAVKATDDGGVENTEIVTLIVNGGVMRKEPKPLQLEL
jgi:DNA modification methylase